MRFVDRQLIRRHDSIAVAGPDIEESTLDAGRLQCFEKIERAEKVDVVRLSRARERLGNEALRRKVDDRIGSAAGDRAPLAVGVAEVDVAAVVRQRTAGAATLQDAT